VAHDLAFGVLGRLVVTSDGAALEFDQTPRRVLAALLLGRGGPVSVDQLIEDVWGGAPPRSARHALEVHVSALRSVASRAATC
jgi:DNA-binding SARP family transcriptional activator